jgi:hypothetical protein
MWSNCGVADPRILIVGSGPSAFAAAEMISSKGLTFEVYDAGLIYPNSKSASPKNAKGTVRKLIFGFDFPYREFSEGPIIDLGDTMASQSFALGGFSNVWGATILPYTDDDLKSWPISFSDLQKYYDFISERIPIAADEDGLKAKYPLPRRYYRNLELSNRLEQLLIDFSRNGNSGYLGRSRLAVQNSTDDKACVYCAKCIIGCDFGLIWNANSYWYSLKKNQKYFPNRRVLRFFIENNSNFVEFVDHHGKVFNEGPFDLMFLGAGPLETFRILNQSKLVSDKTILKDSQIIFAPVFIGGNTYRNPGHTLSQLFLRLENNLVHPINVQLYEYSEEVISRVRKLVPLLRLVPKRMLDLILSKFIYSLIYLDSENSDHISVKSTETGNLELRTVKNLKTNVGTALKSVEKWCGENGLYFSRFLAKKGRAGEGVHYGGTVPFNSAVNSDGSVGGFPNLYIIDSSTFNTIPAGPITFTIMANSARVTDLATS